MEWRDLDAGPAWPEMTPAEARAHYRAVVARLKAIWREHGPVLNDPALRGLRRISQGAIRQLRALGENV